MGNYTKAAVLYHQALGIWRATTGENHHNYCLSLNNLAELHYVFGDWESAEPLVRRVLDIRRKLTGENHPDFAMRLATLATLAGARNRFKDAIELMGKAELIEDRMLGQVFSISSERQRAAHLERLAENLATFLSLFLESDCRTPSTIRSGLDVSLRRKAMGAEALAVQRDVALSGKYPVLAGKLHELTAVRRQIAQKYLAGPGPEGPEIHEQLLTKWSAEQERMEVEIAREIPELSMERKLRTADRRAVASMLPDSMVLAWMPTRG